jgi:hypothetical protein
MEWSAILRDLFAGLLIAGRSRPGFPKPFGRDSFGRDSFGRPAGLGGTTWLNIAFLVVAAVLVARFVASGGMPMLRIMGGSPDAEHEHHDQGEHHH